MQQHAPEAVDLRQETADHARPLRPRPRRRRATSARAACWPAGWSSAACASSRSTPAAHHNDDNWDAHGDLVANHTKHAGATDQPIAGLLKDLKQRGLLDETLVVWGGEFGRQPTAEYAIGTGRDHNSYGFTMWMAGGGIKGGVSVGSTDELGSAAVEKPIHVKRLHATVLQQLGLDPNALVLLLPRPRPEARRRRTGRSRSAKSLRDRRAIAADSHCYRKH